MIVRKTVVAVALACVASAAVVAMQNAGPEKAKIDQPAKAYTLKNLLHDPKSKDSEKVDLASLKGKKSYVLFFAASGCSVTWMYEKRMGKLMAAMKDKDVNFYTVHCSQGDTPDTIKKFCDARNFDWPLLTDSTGAMTRYYNVTNTPTFVLVDKQGTLRYKGGFDNSADEAGVTKKYLPDAIASVLGGTEVAVKEARALG